MSAAAQPNRADAQSPVLFPFDQPPDVGDVIEVAPGISWLRLALPFRLDHVNVYLIEDGDGVCLVDTGIGDAATQAVWDTLLTGVLRSRPPSRIIVTHYHPDHAGNAAWLSARTGAPVFMSETEYLTSLVIGLDPGMLDSEPYRSFYLNHGLDEATTAILLSQGNRYLKMVTGMPRTFRRVIAGETLEIGGRRFAVLTGGGHSPEQIMLYCRAERLLLSADQVLARISPNISVQAKDPEGDPLGIFLRSLDELRQAIPADALVLPGHHLPFSGLHARIAELEAHHAGRCAAIQAACHEQSRTAAELVPVVFGRPIDDPHQMGFAFSEALAHANFMCRQGRLRQTGGRFESVPGAAER